MSNRIVISFEIRVWAIRHYLKVTEDRNPLLMFKDVLWILVKGVPFHLAYNLHVVDEIENTLYFP